MLREATHVQFIDDRLRGIDIGRLVITPIEFIVQDQTASRGLATAPGNAPGIATGQRLGVGVQEIRLGIKAVHLRFRIGDTIHAVGIGEARIESLEESVPDLTRAMEARIEGKFDPRLLGARGEDYQRHRGGITTCNSKIYTIAPHGRPEWQWMSRVQFDLDGVRHAQRLGFHDPSLICMLFASPASVPQPPAIAAAGSRYTSLKRMLCELRTAGCGYAWQSSDPRWCVPPAPCRGFAAS